MTAKHYREKAQADEAILNNTLKQEIASLRSQWLGKQSQNYVDIKKLIRCAKTSDHIDKRKCGLYYKLVYNKI